MTDFYDELERQLHGAADRRARLGWLAPAFDLRGARVVAATALVAVVAVAVIGGLGAVRQGAEDEALVPAAGVEAGCAAATAERFAVLRRPATERDVLPPAVRDAVDQDQPGLGRPEFDPQAARLARSEGKFELWVVPVCLPGDEPAVCFVLRDGETGIPACGPPERAAERGLQFVVHGTPQEGRPFVAALLPDGAPLPVAKVGDEIRAGSFEDSVLVVTFDDPADADRAELVLDDDGNPYPPVAGCGPETVPDELVDRFAVLRADPGPATDFRLDDPDVIRVYGTAARPVRFPNGLEALAVPVLTGECGGAFAAGVCLVPFDREWPTECAAARPGEPFVLGLERANEHGETEIAGIVSDDVTRVRVTAPARGFDVDAEGGSITATSPGDPADVSVQPAA